MNIDNFRLPGRTVQESLAQIQLEKDSQPCDDFKIYMQNLDFKSGLTFIHYPKKEAA